MEGLRPFRQALDREYRRPLSLEGAIARYARWRGANPKATPAARRQFAAQMLRLHALDAHGEIARYHLYRHTYFADAPDAVKDALDRLLARLFERPGEPATRLVELSEAQAALAGVEDRRAFGELVFPDAATLQEAEVAAAPGKARAFVLSHVTGEGDHRYAVREPTGPAEIGRLYRLLSESGLQPGGASRHLVMLDAEERVVGGVTWRPAGPRVAHVEGIVLAPSVRSQRLAGPLVEDFCARLAGAGYAAVHTHFGPGPFPFAPGFRVDRRWGGLVRFLGGEKADAPAAVAAAAPSLPQRVHGRHQVRRRLVAALARPQDAALHDRQRLGDVEDVRRVPERGVEDAALPVDLLPDDRHGGAVDPGVDRPAEAGGGEHLVVRVDVHQVLLALDLEVREPRGDRGLPDR